MHAFVRLVGLALLDTRAKGKPVVLTSVCGGCFPTWPRGSGGRGIRSPNVVDNSTACGVDLTQQDGLQHDVAVQAAARYTKIESAPRRHS